ncbi:uncharacterized protein MONBRDRAFT_14898 [Monosiga brevicollis MX1]|uniref:MIP18 family-like domain-containing protein n=1 Tax=Monosiga brevicollis TaxID=81824 RepID=A9UT22_MONBE|nr:uncharacterized protein MONBRDRAFT_14898 [Monosiga brevicollis MX1]EDQ91168.1 predicted protein [Monosiga brevicollis MX1]|eukprot:XP_001743590.1 hypothetical protein [Monosiga brevicollis MX1]
MALENAAPRVYGKVQERVTLDNDFDDDVIDPFDSREIFDLVRHINDPEHPLTLEELNVVRLDQILVDDAQNYVRVQFTPTIPHCSMASLIGLCLRVRLLRALPPRFKVDVEIFPGTHATEASINKQLADKERVAAALENPNLKTVVNECLQLDDKYLD